MGFFVQFNVGIKKNAARPVNNDLVKRIKNPFADVCNCLFPLQTGYPPQNIKQIAYQQGQVNDFEMEKALVEKIQTVRVKTQKRLKLL
ncbi:MAG: hypothetical protein A2324_13830 [Candidatus Raymondbacteria bacterium RIFOXYB2_FULL_49_35]|nr:MAG: hypothetical protein A2324_13830 [Candidatus Raymondbacteria bacterium RIFOXYB2_FULL_49_35]